MDEKDKHDSKLIKQSKSSRSVFDFSSVEDLRETDRDLVPTDKTQPKIPFNKSYIAHAPSRHLFTLNSRYTYFGGFGASCKDMGGSVEDLTGYMRKDKRNLSLSKFSKSSPDLFGASYQSSNSDDVTLVTEQETHEDFVTHLDIETNLEKEREHRNARSVKRGENNNGKGNESITETKHEDDTKLRLETKWATKTDNEARFQLSMSTLQIDTRRQHTSYSSEAKNDATASIFERLDKTDEGETTTLQHPGANDADARLVSEISVSKYNDEEKSEGFDKGWKTILHSGKAELKKSLENLNSFRQDMNSREIHNVDTSETERSVSDESVELHQSTGEEMILKHTSEERETKDYETGNKRNDEMAGLNMDDLLRNGKRQKVSQENVREIFSQGSSSICVSNTADHNKQINYSGMMSCEEEKYTTNKVNTDEATMAPQDKTANGNEEKQTALSIINSKNDNLDLCTSKEEHAAVNDLCLSSDVEMFQTNHRNRSDSKAPKTEGNYGSSLIMYNSTVEQMEAGVPQATDDHNQSGDKTVNSEESSKGIVHAPSCNLFPISLRVLSNSYHENIAWQNTEEFRRESTNATVKVSEIRQSRVSVTEDDKTTVDCDQSLLNSWINKPNNWLNKDPYGGSFETANKTKDNLKSQTIEEKKQTIPFNSDCNRSLSNSTHEPSNNWLSKDPYGGSFETANKTKDNLKSQTIEEKKQTIPFNKDCNRSLSNSTHEPGNNWLNKNPYGASFEIANKTKDNLKSQTIEDEKQTIPFDNDCNRPLSNSTHESNNNWLNNITGTENAKNDDSRNETADNPLIKNMMGMFCLLGLKDSAEGGFYSNGQLQCREQEIAKDRSEENEQEWCVDETIMKPSKTVVNITKYISKSLFASNENEGSFEEQESLNDIKAESPVNWDYNERTDVDKGTKSDDSANNVEKTKIQQITLYKSPQKQGTLDEYISDVLTLEEKSIVDKDLLLNLEPDKTLHVSDIEKGKQEEAVKHRNTEGYIDEGVLLQNAMTQDLLLQTPDDGYFQAKEEIIVQLNMRENYGSHFIANTADLLTTSKDGGLKLSSENKQEQKNMTTSNLEINRNKWSHALIIPLRTMNTSKKLSGAFNILVLDSELIPTSPERKPTVVTLNFYAHEDEEKYPRGKNIEVSRVDIQMNDEKEKFKVGDSNSDLLQEPENEDSNSVEENVLQSNLADNIEVVIDQDNSENHPGQMDYTNEILTHDHVLETTSYLENGDIEVAINNEIQQSIFQTDESTTNKTFMEKVPEKYLPDFEEKETHETISGTVVQTKPFDNMQPDYFAKLESNNPIQTVQKVDVRGTKDKRLSEHLMSFETDELVDEKITKQEKTEQKNLFTEFVHGIFLLENKIQETITKEEMKGVQHEILSAVDELFTSEEGMEEQETEENNNVILLQKEEVSLSELTTQKVVEKPKHPNDSSQLQKEVPEVITKAVDDRSLQYKYLFQLDEVLQPEYVNEFVPNKLKAQHDNHDNLLETDKYFDSLKNSQQTNTQSVNNIQLVQSSEFPEQRTSPESPTKNVEKSVAYTLIPRQNNEVGIVQTDKDRYDSGPCVMEEDLQEDAWEITFGDQEVLPAKEVVSVSTKDTRVSNTNGDELILMISHPRNSIHDGDDDIDYIDDVRQCTASPIPGDLSSVTSNYDASAESSSESTQNYTQHQSNGEDCLLNHDVPWDVTVTYPNPDTMESGYKILRASYSNIQPEVYKVESQTADVKVTVDGKNIDGKAIGGRNKPLHIPKQCEVAEQLHTSHPTTVKSTENNFNTNKHVTLNGGTLVGNENQYRTTMDIQQNHNQVSTSYVLFQRFGKQESPKTYFELNYDADKWKVGETISSHKDDDLDKTFVVSYATIEQVNHPLVASPVYLPTIEDDEIYDEDVYYVQATQLSNESKKVRIEFLQSSPALPPLSPPHTPLQSPSSSPPPLPPQLSSQTPVSSPPQLPTTTKAGTLEVQKQETNLYTIHYTNEDSRPENTPYPLLPPPETSYTQKIEEEVSHHLEGIFEAQEEKGPVGKHYPLPQPPTETVREEVQLVEIDYNLQQESTHKIPCQVPPTPPAEDIGQHLPEPLEISPEDLPYESSRTIQLPPPVSESRPPVWSFAQSVFHTDGQSKTFFKVIDNRNKSFQSSTFMYRGDRIKVSRKVNVFKNQTENWKQDIGDEQTMDSRVNEDYEGYSEIWDDGNFMPVDNEVMMERNEAVTRSTVAYEMATEQDFFTEQGSRNCSWHLNLRGDNGVCKISPDNLDAIAVEDDNTLIGSKGFISGQHRWVIQGLGIFCAVGVCYPGAENWYKGNKWVWTTDGLKYSEPTGIRRSEFGQWRNEDVLVISIDCEEQIIRIVNTRTNVEATLHGFKGEVYPYFNIYKGSSIRLLQTSMG